MTKVIDLRQQAEVLNLSDDLVQVIIRRGLIPTTDISHTQTTIYGMHQLKRISSLLDQGKGFSEIEKVIEH